MEKDIYPTDQDGQSRGHVNQVKSKYEQLGQIVIGVIFLQIVAAIIVSLFQLVGASCNAIPSTILYSLERGSEGISMSLEDATLARKLLQQYCSCG